MTKEEDKYDEDDNIIEDEQYDVDKLIQSNGNEWTQANIKEDYSALVKEYKREIYNVEVKHSVLIFRKFLVNKIKKLEERIEDLENNSKLVALNSKIVELETINSELQNELELYTLSKSDEEFDDKVQKTILNNVYNDLGATRKMINKYLKENK